MLAQVVLGFSVSFIGIFPRAGRLLPGSVEALFWLQRICVYQGVPEVKNIFLRW